MRARGQVELTPQVQGDELFSNAPAPPALLRGASKSRWPGRGWLLACQRQNIWTDARASPDKAPPPDRLASAADRSVRSLLARRNDHPKIRSPDNEPRATSLAAAPKRAMQSGFVFRRSAPADEARPLVGRAQIMGA